MLSLANFAIEMLTLRAWSAAEPVSANCWSTLPKIILGHLADSIAVMWCCPPASGRGPDPPDRGASVTTPDQRGIVDLSCPLDWQTFGTGLSVAGSRCHAPSQATPGSTCKRASTDHSTPRGTSGPGFDFVSTGELIAVASVGRKLTMGRDALSLNIGNLKKILGFVHKNKKEVQVFKQKFGSENDDF